MNKELDLWQFVRDRLRQNQAVILLVVATSTGSSPGRQGYKMAVASDGELFGSIGGGVMEVRLVEQSRAVLSVPPAVAGGLSSAISEQIHQRTSQNASGMICSGKQTVIFKQLNGDDLGTVKTIIFALKNRELKYLFITPILFRVGPPKGGTLNEDTLNEDYTFEKLTDRDFFYRERLGKKNDLYIVGGGHCALALSELMAKMDFHIRIFDDRPELNTLEKNRFADEISVIDDYEQIGDMIPAGSNIYVVVMTLGYTSDEVVIRKLLDKDFKYFGVLGSKAKMATLLKNLKSVGFDAARLDQLHTPIGLAINSRTPEEIAVSIAAEIIAVKNMSQY